MELQEKEGEKEKYTGELFKMSPKKRSINTRLKAIYLEYRSKKDICRQSNSELSIRCNIFFRKIKSSNAGQDQKILMSAFL